MFTVNQIKEAHSKVKSGADFPAYIQDIKKLGVYSRYEFDFIKMYIDNLQEKAFKKIDNIINFPLPPAPGPDITPQKAPEFYSSQLDIFGGEQKVICNYSQMSLF